MQLQLNEKKKELKRHGNFSFPVYISQEILSRYERGTFSWHWHTEVELTLVLEGTIAYQVNDRLYRLKAGDGLFCNSNALHTGRMIDGQDCYYLSVTFHPRVIYGFDGSLLHTDYVRPITGSAGLGGISFHAGTLWQDRILTRLHEIYQLYLEPPATAEFQIQQQLSEIWRLLYENIEQHQPHRTVAVTERNLSRLREILTYIENHYAEKLTLADIADQIHLCESECCRFFKRNMNVSLFDYLMTFRIEKSLPLLSDQTLSISDVAERTGFSSPGYFSRVFKSRMGCSPLKYKSGKLF